MTQLQPIGIIRPGVAVNVTLAVFMEDEQPICLLHSARILTQPSGGTVAQNCGALVL